MNDLEKKILAVRTKMFTEQMSRPKFVREIMKIFEEYRTVKK